MGYRNTSSFAHRPTLEEWFSNPFVETLPTNNSFNLDEITVHNTLLNPTVDNTSSPLTEQNTLVQVLNGSTRLIGHQKHHNYNVNVTTGNLMIVPRFTDINATWNSSVAVGFLHFSHSLLIELIAPSYQGDTEHIEFLPQYDMHDSFLRSVGIMLYQELENENLFGSLFAETLIHSIIIHLTRNYSNIASLPTPSGSRLSTLQLRILDEYINSHLHQKISLKDLAKCIHFSIPHLERAFRMTLHCPPYQYVLERRIEKAKILLTHTHLTLFDVARECGFANQSHLTRHFTKMVSISPAQFRRSTKI